MARGPFYPVGAYRGTITQQGFAEAKTGTPQFFLQVKIESHEGGQPVETSYERTIFRALTANTVQFFKEDLEAIGYTQRNPFSFSHLDPDTPGFDSLVGREVALWCKHETGTDGDRERWQISRPASKFEGTPVAPNKMRQLDSLLGRAMKGSATAPAARPAATC